MNSVSNSSTVNCTSANLGVVTPPDKIGRPEILSASQMESQLRLLKSDIYQKQKHVSFEDKKKTPIIIKIIGLALACFGLWKGGKYLISKYRKPPTPSV